MTSTSEVVHAIAAAQQSGNRGVELWTTDLSGQIWTLYQTTAGGAWSSWEGPGFKGQSVPAWQVAAADQNTGCLMLFMTDMEGSVWCIPQMSPGGNWGSWSGPWLHDQPRTFGPIAASQQSGNRGVELWAIDADGQIWTLYQTTPGGSWSNWEGPGFKGQSVPMTRVAAAEQNTGCVMLFSLDTNGQVWSIGQLSPGGNWGGWSGPGIANQPKPFHQISASQQWGNRGVELWATDETGEIWTLYQTTPGGSWSNWEGPGFKGQNAQMSRTAAAGQNNGNVRLFSIEYGGALWTISQNSPGGNWGGWSELPSPPVEPMSGWLEVGSGFTGIFSGGGLLYAVDAQNTLSLFSATVGEWTAMNGPAASQYVGTSDAVYSITSDETAVMCLDAATLAWSTIGSTSTFGGPMTQLIPALNALHGVDGQGTVWMYTDTPNEWMSMGGPFQTVCANDSYCFAIAEDGQSVQMCPSGTTDWSTIGSAMASIVAAGNNLYGVDAAGAVFLYSGTPMQWTSIGSGFAQLCASGIALYGLASDKSSVQEYLPSFNLWAPVAGAADSFCAGEGFVAGLQSQTVYVRLLGAEGAREQAEAESSTGTQSESRTLTASADAPLPVNSRNWMLTFTVSANMPHAYYGELMVKVSGDAKRGLFMQGGWQAGQSYAFALQLNTTDLTTLSLLGNHHFLPNGLQIDSIKAWNIATGEIYTFTVDETIPNQNAAGTVSWSTFSYDSVEASGPPAGSTLVYVWPTRLTSRYSGHTSMMLSDGTYLGWWPYGFLVMSFLPPAYMGKHAPPEDVSYQNDLDKQGSAPPLVLSLQGIDEAKIKAWWEPYLADENNLYEALTNNCATVVYQALQIGGAVSELSTRLQDNYATVIPWTPGEVMQLMLDIQATRANS
ncbi:hypothetical protein [Trinickia acidisoli]|uniref:hypothetical protein n=1 Tax=Trinickia acidisoli TaxID=2767482 RepID=UPI001A8ED43D|nr:hypothetical protein [Trinickia acidisoli]